MPWFSIRAVYVHERTPDEAAFFEERILLFSARDAEHAFDLADGESQRYLQLNPGFQRIGELVAFALHVDGSDLNGSEIWSAVARSDVAPDQYYRRRYTAFELQPE